MSVNRLPTDRYIGPVLPLLAAFALSVSSASPAGAQIQSQGVTVGGARPPGGGGGKPTQAECLSQAKAKGLKGKQLKLFVRNCLK